MTCTTNTKAAALFEQRDGSRKFSLGTELALGTRNLYPEGKSASEYHNRNSHTSTTPSRFQEQSHRRKPRVS